MVSRNEGYRRGAGKEEVSISVLQDFLRDLVGTPGEPITGADENYRHGDLRFSPTVTVECKGQPIDPLRYRQNFVEVFEETGNARHSGGFDALAGLLGVPSQKLEKTAVRSGGRTTALGRPPFLSVSVTSIAACTFTAYVNHQQGGRHIYLYGRDEIMGHIRSAVTTNGLVRGAGNSNEDTFAVFVPLAAMRWTRKDGSWVATGETPADKARKIVAAALT